MPIPITVFTGFLGAGKTSVILSLLPQLPKDYKVVLLKNEYGDLAVDSQLANQSSLAAVSEITNGCMCCVLVGQMQTALLEIRENYKPDRIIIECSGSAFPATLAFQIRELERETDGDLKLDAIVTVVDAENFAGYEDTSPTAKMQASYTDIILINKWELVDERTLDTVLDHLHTLNDLTPKIRCRGRNGVDPNLIFGLESTLFRDPDAFPAPEHNDEVETVSVVSGLSLHRHNDDHDHNHLSPTTDGASSIEDKQLLDALGKVSKESVWRIKGFVRLTGERSGMFILNWAFGRCELTAMAGDDVGRGAVSLTIMGERGEVKRCIRPFSLFLTLSISTPPPTLLAAPSTRLPSIPLPLPFMTVTTPKPAVTVEQALPQWSPAPGRLGNLSKSQASALDELKASGEFLDPRHDDAWLLRFLRARKFDVAKTKEMLRACEKWRKEFGVDELVRSFKFEEAAEVDKHYSQYYHGMDKTGRPVYFEHIGKLNVKALYACTTQERLLQNLVVEYESFLNSRLPACSAAIGHPVETSLTILDLGGVSLSNFIRVKDYVFAATHIGQNYYPEVLGSFYIINSPWAFSTIWSVIRKWLDEVTVAKVHIVGGPKEFQPLLLKQIDADMLPKTLGGECVCEGSCSLSDTGPWNPRGGQADSPTMSALAEKMGGAIITIEHTNGQVLSA
ncbi:cobW domain-containing protein [Mycena kentingensis (nom. inval.)]|nr:cobW domain-containing protein [Mycena kentingensis (nom. inval.)]